VPRDISHLAGDLTKRANNLSRAIDHGARDIVLAGAKVAKTEHLVVMRQHAGGDLRLSRVRSGRGATIGARYDLRGDTAEVKATGPVPLLANPIKAHRIPRANARRRKVLSIPGIGVRASAQHPGTKGKDTWNEGRERAAPRVRTAIARKSDEVVKRAFLSGG
jgi:hypothetical protein